MIKIYFTIIALLFIWPLAGCSGEDRPQAILKSLASSQLLIHDFNGAEADEANVKSFLLNMASQPECSLENIYPEGPAHELELTVQSGKNPILIRVKIYKNVIFYEMGIVPSGPWLKPVMICGKERVATFIQNNRWAFAASALIRNSEFHQHEE